MIDKLLSMLNQFLVSNQELTLNETFCVYVNVLSLPHMEERKILKKTTRKRKNFGAKSTKKLQSCLLNKTYKYHNYWSVDVPQLTDDKPNLFYEKCLLTTCILGHLQNQYFESNCKNLQYIYALNVNSKSLVKQRQAFKVIENELKSLEEHLSSLNISTYTDFDVLAPILSDYFKAQIFIFTGLQHHSKIKHKYPSAFDLNLKPIYLYEPFDELGHLTFIRHLNSYFKANFTICFGCEKIFKHSKKLHICPKIPTCFACRRFYMTDSTYINSKNKHNFCNRYLVNDNEMQCKTCNATVFSKDCNIRHKKLCGNKGLGWKCPQCKIFFYKNGAHGQMFTCSEDIENNHKCAQKVVVFVENCTIHFQKMNIYVK